MSLKGRIRVMAVKVYIKKKKNTAQNEGVGVMVDLD